MTGTLTKSMCPAMENRGIKDPDSRDGIDFCLNDCPYDKCIVYEGSIHSNVIKKGVRKTMARNMYNDGYRVRDIAAKLGVALATVKGYIYRK